MGLSELRVRLPDELGHVSWSVEEGGWDESTPVHALWVTLRSGDENPAQLRYAALSLARGIARRAGVSTLESNLWDRDVFIKNGKIEVTISLRVREPEEGRMQEALRELMRATSARR